MVNRTPKSQAVSLRTPPAQVKHQVTTPFHFSALACEAALARLSRGSQLEGPLPEPLDPPDGDALDLDGFDVLFAPAAIGRL